jgi:hypothetical protein
MSGGKLSLCFFFTHCCAPPVGTTNPLIPVASQAECGICTTVCSQCTFTQRFFYRICQSTLTTQEPLGKWESEVSSTPLRSTPNTPPSSTSVVCPFSQSRAPYRLEFKRMFDRLRTDVPSFVSSNECLYPSSEFYPMVVISSRSGVLPISSFVAQNTFSAPRI